MDVLWNKPRNELKARHVPGFFPDFTKRPHHRTHRVACKTNFVNRKKGPWWNGYVKHGKKKIIKWYTEKREVPYGNLNIRNN